MNMLPPSRPKLTREEALDLLGPMDWKKYPIVAFGIRGYYLNSMGKANKNDHSMYDDAIGIITEKDYIVVNGNTDPSAAEGAIEGRAKLKPGIYPMWKLDLHKGQYRAFCQRAASCVVFRDKTERFQKGITHPKYGKCLGDGYWEGWFGINGHRGGNGTTSSEGCQTTPEPQWTDLIRFGEREARRVWADKWKEGTIVYHLLEQK